jgi:hypothetical protein
MVTTRIVTRIAYDFATLAPECPEPFDRHL